MFTTNTPDSAIAEIPVETDAPLNGWQNLRACWFDLVGFIEAHWIKVAALAVACVAMLSVIGLQNVPYWDDTWRRLDGSTGWAAIDGRIGSELLARLLNSGTPIVDLGLASFILTALFLAAAVTVVLWVVNAYRISGTRTGWLTFVLGLVFALNPWALDAWAFRFDGPLISFGFLLAIASVLLYPLRGPMLLAGYGVVTFVVANFFQPAIGFIAIMYLTRLLLDWLSNRVARNCLKPLALAAAGFLIGAGAYFVQISLTASVRGDVGIADGNLIGTFTTNLRAFLGTFRRENSGVWQFFLLLILLFAIFGLWRYSRQRLVPTLVVIGTYLVITVLAAGGVLLLFNTTHISRDTRFRFPLAMLFALLAIIASVSLPRLKYARLAMQLGLVAFAYLWLSNVFVFANVLAEQRDAQQLQTQIIFRQVNRLARAGDIIVYDPIVFTNSIYAGRVAERFPIYRNPYYVGSLPQNLTFDQFRLAETLGLSSVITSPDRDIWTIREQPVVCELPETALSPVLSGPRWDIWRASDNTICVTFTRIAALDFGIAGAATIRVPLAEFPIDSLVRPTLGELAPTDLTMAIWPAATPDEVQWSTAIDFLDGNAIFTALPPADGWPAGRLVAHFFVAGQYVFQQVWSLD